MCPVYSAAWSCGCKCFIIDVVSVSPKRIDERSVVLFLATMYNSHHIRHLGKVFRRDEKPENVELLAVIVNGKLCARNYFYVLAACGRNKTWQAVDGIVVGQGYCGQPRLNRAVYQRIGRPRSVRIYRMRVQIASHNQTSPVGMR